MNAASVTIGPDGGSIETTASDGTHFTLEIPPLALLEETAITITPAIATQTPFSGGALAAIQFEPSGLTLWAPGTLTVRLGAAPDPAALVGFSWAGSGGSVGLELVQVTDAQLVYSVTHFSGLGAALAAPADLATLVAGPTSSAAQAYLNQVVTACESSDASMLQATLRDWYDSAIAPGLSAADSDPVLTQALRDFEAWRGAVDLVPVLCDLVASPPDLGSRLASGASLAAAALRDAIDRAHLRCRALQEIPGAEEALRWQAIAEAMNLVGAGSGLSLEDVRTGLCMEIVYRDTDYASTPRTGLTSPLTVEVGISFPALSNLPFDQPIAVKVDAQGTRETSANGYTDGLGIFTAPFTPDGSGPISFTIKSCYDDPGFPKVSKHVCQTAILARGIEVTPPTAQVQSGATQQFSALLLGDPYAKVTWSATGGTIDANGLFTADASGTVTVTATDQANSGSRASATVTVAASACDFGSFQPGVRAFVNPNNQADLGVLAMSPPEPLPLQVTASDGANSVTATGSFGRLATTLHVAWSPPRFHGAVANPFFVDAVIIDSGIATLTPYRVRVKGRLIANGMASGTHTFRHDVRFSNADPNQDRIETGGSSLGDDRVVEWDIFSNTGGQTGSAGFSIRVDIENFMTLSSFGELDFEASFQWLGITGVFDRDGVPITGYTICSASGTDWRQPAK